MLRVPKKRGLERDYSEFCVLFSIDRSHQKKFHFDNLGFICVEPNCNCINKNNPANPKGEDIIDTEVVENEN